mmetsp:Transcript_34615/g.108706  ORF Transcript_34615/g.108706 Transcript_34615/m.108706 type:complete len:247 (+) Transcript_34615:389-1129(+)
MARAAPCSGRSPRRASPRRSASRPRTPAPTGGRRTRGPCRASRRGTRIASTLRTRSATCRLARPVPGKVRPPGGASSHHPADRSRRFFSRQAAPAGRRVKGDRQRRGGDALSSQSGAVRAHGARRHRHALLPLLRDGAHEAGAVAGRLALVAAGRAAAVRYRRPEGRPHRAARRGAAAGGRARVCPRGRRVHGSGDRRFARLPKRKAFARQAKLGWRVVVAARCVISVSLATLSGFYWYRAMGVVV